MRMKFAIGALCVFFGALAAQALPDAEAKALDRLEHAQLPVTIRFDQVELAQVFAAVAGVGSIEIELAEPLRETPVSIELDKQTIKEALIALADKFGLRYEVSGARRLVVTKRPEPTGKS